MKLHRKIKHNENVCRLQDLDFGSRSQSRHRSKSCFSNNSKTTEAKLTKLHRKKNIMRSYVAHRSKVPSRKVSVTIRSEFKLCLKSCLSNNSKTTEANLMKLHRKIKHNGRCVTHKS